MIKRLVPAAKRSAKGVRAKKRLSPRRGVKRGSAKGTAVDAGTAAAEGIFLMYEAREAAHAKSKA